MRKKNIVYIYADDLGRGMLSCYGQKLIRTKNIDRLAETGMRFTNFCANAFCAPARASLICGIHDAHAGRWTFTPGAYYKKLYSGEASFEQLQEVLQHTHIRNDAYIADVAKKAGYYTGQIGKLEWGFSVTAKQMFEHGWDYHYGYYDHVMCHGFYPPFLFENGVMVDIEGNTDIDCGRPDYDLIYDENYRPDTDMTERKQYSQDLFDRKVIEFIRQNRNRPFFLYHPSQLPHGLIYYPDLHEQVKYRDDLTLIEKEYASMVLRLDETVGKIIDEIEDLGLRNDTIIMFASDNGHTIDYVQPDRTSMDITNDGRKTDNKDRPFRSADNGDIFNGNDGMAGLKFSNWNGGCVVPFIASCPSMIGQGTVNDSLVTNYDTLATVAEITGGPLPGQTDGISYMPMLRGDKYFRMHEHVIYSSDCGPAVVDRLGYKLRVFIEPEALKEGAYPRLTNSPRVDYQLYDLNDDFAERHNIARSKPEIVQRLKKTIIEECDGNLLNGTPNAHFTYPVMDPVRWRVNRKKHEASGEMTGQA